MCAHGPPLSGRDEIRPGVIDARDAVQFLWDQTVRGINNGLTLGELIDTVQLPKRFDRSYLTQQHYGLVEHHIRQIHAGLRGWFDGYEADLFPLPTRERTTKLIEGFGGRSAVLSAAEAALADNDLRWALELATWLVRSETGPDGRADGGTSEERSMLASALRAIAQRTTSANNRNWCLTRALELDGNVDLSRLRGFRANRFQVLSRDPATFVHGLKVILEPDRSEGLHAHVGFDFGEGVAAGLQIRDGVAVPTDGADADYVLSMALETWADLLTKKTTLRDAVSAGHVSNRGGCSRGTDRHGVLRPRGIRSLALATLGTFKTELVAGARIVGTAQAAERVQCDRIDSCSVQDLVGDVERNHFAKGHRVFERGATEDLLVDHSAFEHGLGFGDARCIDRSKGLGRQPSKTELIDRGLHLGGGLVHRDREAMVDERTGEHPRCTNVGEAVFDLALAHAGREQHHRWIRRDRLKEGVGGEVCDTVGPVGPNPADRPWNDQTSHQLVALGQIEICDPERCTGWGIAQAHSPQSRKL